MFLHSVFFWLRPDLQPSQVSEFEAGVRQLMAIETVRFRYLGTPAATDRPVIDRSYSYQLVVGFDDLAGHDFYQQVDIHLAFIQRFAGYWHKVQIYDAVESAGAKSPA